MIVTRVLIHSIHVVGKILLIVFIIGVVLRILEATVILDVFQHFIDCALVYTVNTAAFGTTIQMIIVPFSTLSAILGVLSIILSVLSILLGVLSIIMSVLTIPLSMLAVLLGVLTVLLGVLTVLLGALTVPLDELAVLLK